MKSLVSLIFVTGGRLLRPILKLNMKIFRFDLIYLLKKYFLLCNFPKIYKLKKIRQRSTLLKILPPDKKLLVRK